MKYLLIILCSLFLACNSSNSTDKIKTEPNAYFDFDEIEFYNNTNGDADFVNILKNGKKLMTDSLKKAVLLFDSPKSLGDTLFLIKLGEIDYKKINIDPSNYANIKEIFKKKVANNSSVTSCEPVYRNLLIFRNKYKLVGIARICFGCKRHQIVATNITTDDFGQEGDYEKLKMILFKNEREIGGAGGIQ
jgi:hypothetical protein